MNSTTKALLIIGSILMVCLTALGIAVVVSGGDDSTPAPVPETSTPAPTETSDTDEAMLQVLEDIWSDTSPSEQQNLCILFNYSSEDAWNAFNSGANNLLPKELFMEFFSEKCSTF
jgi:hypothetical protein